MKTFYERYWQGRTGTKLKDFDLKWPKLRRYIPSTKEIVILDFGCGNGKIIKEMMSVNPKAKIIGLDVSESALKVASELLHGVEFRRIVDGGRFPIADGAVDFIFTSEVIEHVYDVRNAFSEMSRVLRLGGRILLTTPYHGFLKNILIVLFNFEKHFDPTGPHVRFFTKKSLVSCFRKAGLEPHEHGYFGRFYPFPHCIFVVAEKVASNAI